MQQLFTSVIIITIKYFLSYIAHHSNSRNWTPNSIHYVRWTALKRL